jgi:hypothetical protein
MKQAITSGVFAIAFVSLLVLGLVSRVQARECSNAVSFQQVSLIFQT